MGPLQIHVHDIYLYFQSHKFETLISRKWRELSQKCIIWLLQRLILHDLDLIFQGQTFLLCICYKKFAATDVPGKSASTHMAPPWTFFINAVRHNVWGWTHPTLVSWLDCHLWPTEIGQMKASFDYNLNTMSL